MAGRRDIVLIDTNVLLSAVLFGGKPGELLDLVRTGRLADATSLYILREFQQVLTRIIVTGDRLLLQAKIPGVEVLTVSAMLQRLDQTP